MKKNLKVIQIRGFKGLFMALFIISCLIAGFIAFPAFLSMNAWNYLCSKVTSLPEINFFQGLLLWAILAFSAFIFNNKKFIVSFNSEQELSEDEVKQVISRIKTQTLEKHMLVPKDFKIKESQEDEIDKNQVK